MNLSRPPRPTPRLTPLTISLVILLSVTTIPALAQVPGELKEKVAPVVPMQAEAFHLEDVRLLDGPFRSAMELDRKYLLELDVDRLLHNFRVNAGIPSEAKPLGGWEDPNVELRGHFTGHFMSACALMYAATGDVRLKEKGDAVVAGLAAVQAKMGSGYLSAFPESFIDRVERREPVWAPWYTLHKILAGLIDMDVHCDNKQALDVAEKFAGWVRTRTGNLSEEQMQAMLGTEHGGMNEALANLYALTGNRQYLDLAARFNHIEVLRPASRGRDRLTGLHANTQIPKFIGAAREYEMIGAEWLKAAALFFWETVVKERSYVIGGHSDGEAFSDKRKLSRALGPDTTETCNTYNMLKLTRHLFFWDPRVGYADYYERALFNHILASQDPASGMMCYYVPLRSGSRKNYNTPDKSFWCCTGTGVENHAKYGDSIYFHAGDRTLYLSQFIASELRWKATGCTVRQETRYPDEGSSRIAFTCDAPVDLSVKVRHPSWAVSGFEVRVNGEKQDLAAPAGSWVTLSRTWRSGDTVEIAMPFSLRVEGFQDDPDRFAFLNGPLVLAAQVEAGRPFPGVVSESASVTASLAPVAGHANTYSGAGNTFRIPGERDGAGVTLEPFYAMHGERRYQVYFDRYTEAQWRSKEEEYAAERKRLAELEARTIDKVAPGDTESERGHGMTGERTDTGDFGGRRYRDASENGWFSYVLKVTHGVRQELIATYWGGDRGRTFDILVDGVRIATERFRGGEPIFDDRVYRLPADLLEGKPSVTVRFAAAPDGWAGGVFGVRIIDRSKRKR